MKIDFQYAWSQLINNWPLFWYGIKMTIAFAVVGTLAGLIIGLIIGAIRCVPLDPLDKPVTRFFKRLGRFITGFYVWVFRGTPMMVQAVFLYYLFKPVLHWNNFTAGMVIISVNTAAYMAEIIRAGIQSVDIGQMEAGRSLGLPYWKTMRKIILPQAIRTMIPSIINQFIITVKDTSILSVIGFPELVLAAKQVQANTFKAFETWAIVGIMYLIVITILSYLAKLVERRMNRGINR